MIEDKWSKRFLNLAKEISTWSKDPKKQVGAVIIDPLTLRITGLGYNGPPSPVDDTVLYRKDKNKFIVHAEFNAILNASKTKDCIMFIYPGLACNECAKSIVAAGIVQVESYSCDLNPKWNGQYTDELFNLSGVTQLCGRFQD